MQKNVQCLYLKNNLLLLAEVVEVAADIGEPDCKLVEPYTVDPSTLELEPWLLNITMQNEYMISSDKILTLAEPTSKLLKKYEDLF